MGLEARQNLQLTRGLAEFLRIYHSLLHQLILCFPLLAFALITTFPILPILEGAPPALTRPAPDLGSTPIDEAGDIVKTTQRSASLVEPCSNLTPSHSPATSTPCFSTLLRNPLHRTVHLLDWSAPSSTRTHPQHCRLPPAVPPTRLHPLAPSPAHPPRLPLLFEDFLALLVVSRLFSKKAGFSLPLLPLQPLLCFGLQPVPKLCPQCQRRKGRRCRRTVGVGRGRHVGIYKSRQPRRPRVSPKLDQSSLAPALHRHETFVTHLDVGGGPRTSNLVYTWIDG